MPVLLERVASGVDVFAPEQCVRERRRPEFQNSNTNCIDIGLVNNMPDAALESTERQFIELLEAAAGNFVIRLRLFSLPDVPRSPAGQDYLKSSYFDVAELWNNRLDGLIVTGTEPRLPSLLDEPYWATFTKLVDWAEANAISTVWSCLAAHAAVLHLDGIGRHALDDKRFGVFDCAKVSDHPLLAGVASPLRIAHSRWNELREDELASCGYTVLTSSTDAGVDMFVKRRKALLILFQGHPEYDERALLREYRRDIGRFLRGQRETYPTMPQGYIDDAAADVLAAFREQALSQRHEELLECFPATMVERHLRSTSGASAARIYRNWLSHLLAEKAKGVKSKVYLPRWRRTTESRPVQGVS